MLSRPLAIGITILVSVVWAGNVAIGVIYPEAHDATINAIFAIIVGAVFGLTPKRETLQSARRRLSRVTGDETADEESAADEPPGDANSPRGDDS